VVIYPEKVSDDKGEIAKAINKHLIKSHRSLQLLNQKGYTSLELKSKIQILERGGREL